MTDFLLDKDGDIVITETGDVAITQSICQAVKIRLKWIAEEWRLGPDLGFDWFNDVFVKNPNLENIKQLLRAEVLQVEGIQEADVSDIDYRPRERIATITCSFKANGETYTEEVKVNV